MTTRSLVAPLAQPLSRPGKGEPDGVRIATRKAIRISSWSSCAQYRFVICDLQGRKAQEVALHVGSPLGERQKGADHRRVLYRRYNRIREGSATVQSGIRVGPYEIVAPIGAGGMGEVCRARDTRLGRDFAIKVLPCLSRTSGLSRVGGGRSSE